MAEEKKKNKRTPVIANRLVGTWLPPALATKVKRAAKSEMISVSAFTRRALANAVPHRRAKGQGGQT
jgi:hypothetical protein